MGSFLHRHRGLTPYLLLAPGLAWLAVFFLAPLAYLHPLPVRELFWNWLTWWLGDAVGMRRGRDLVVLQSLGPPSIRPP